MVVHFIDIARSSSSVLLSGYHLHELKLIRIT